MLTASFFSCFLNRNPEWIHLFPCSLCITPALCYSDCFSDNITAIIIQSSKFQNMLSYLFCIVIIRNPIYIVPVYHVMTFNSKIG